MARPKALLCPHKSGNGCHPQAPEVAPVPRFGRTKFVRPIWALGPGGPGTGLGPPGPGPKWAEQPWYGQTGAPVPPRGLGGGSRCRFCGGKATLLGGAGNALRVVVAPCTNRPATPPCAHTTRWWAGGGMGGVFAATLGAWGPPPPPPNAVAEHGGPKSLSTPRLKCPPLHAGGAPSPLPKPNLGARPCWALHGPPQAPGVATNTPIFFQPPTSGQRARTPTQGGVGASGGGGSWQATPPGGHRPDFAAVP